MKRRRLRGGDAEAARIVFERAPANLFETLPRDVLFMILYGGQLSVLDIVAFCATYKKLHDLCQASRERQQRLWEEMYLAKVRFRDEVDAILQYGGGKRGDVDEFLERKRKDEPAALQVWRDYRAQGLVDSFLLLYVLMQSKCLIYDAHEDADPRSLIVQAPVEAQGRTYMQIAQTGKGGHDWEARIDAGDWSGAIDEPFRREMLALAESVPGNLQVVAPMDMTPPGSDDEFGDLSMGPDATFIYGSWEQLPHFLYHLVKDAGYAPRQLGFPPSCSLRSCIGALAPFLCAGCHDAYYCGPACQSKDWFDGGHAKKCGK